MLFILVLDPQKDTSYFAIILWVGWHVLTAKSESDELDRFQEKDMVQMIIKAILPTGNFKIKFGRYFNCGALFFFNQKMSEENNNEELRPSKMRGVAFPKAKYGVIQQ